MCHELPMFKISPLEEFIIWMKLSAYSALICEAIILPPWLFSNSIPTQLPFVGLLELDVKVITLLEVPEEIIVPLNINFVPELNLIVTPGSIVKVFPGNNATSEVTTYGLPLVLQTVSLKSPPPTFVWENKEFAGF